MLTSLFIAVTYSMIVTALFSLIDRSLLPFDLCNPATVSSIFLSKSGEELIAVVVVLDDDRTSKENVPELYKDTNYRSLQVTKHTDNMRYVGN